MAASASRTEAGGRRVAPARASMRAIDLARVRLVVDDDRRATPCRSALRRVAAVVGPAALQRGVVAAAQRVRGDRRRRGARRGSVTMNVAPCPSPALSACTVAAVQLDDVPHDRQPDAQPAVRARAGAVGLAEAVEDVRQERRR